MDKIAAAIERNYVEDGKQKTVFRLPAVNKKMARRRVRLASRVKGFENPSIGPAEEVRDSDNPGQNLYEVTVTSDR